MAIEIAVCEILVYFILKKVGMFAGDILVYIGRAQGRLRYLVAKVRRTDLTNKL